MSLKIRLARGGSKKRPYYRIVVAEALGPRDGNFIEKVGTFNPLLAKDKAERITLNAERIQYWLSTGAQPTDRVEKFLANAGLVKAPAAKNNPTKAKPKAKAQERIKMAEEAVKAAAEAAEAARAAEEAAKIAAAEAAAAPAEAPAEASAE